MKSISGRLIGRIRASLNYRYAKAESDYWRRRVERAKPEDFIRQSCERRLDNVQVFSFCGRGRVSEQILSFLSFLRHVGRPGQWTIVSDGSLGDDDRVRLSAIYPDVRFADWRHYVSDRNRPCVEPYSQVSPMGKKLALVTSLPVSPASVYIDTDILFFAGAYRLGELLHDVSGNYFLPDNRHGIAEPLLLPGEHDLPPVNAGFLIQAAPLSWEVPLQRLGNSIEQSPEILPDPEAPIRATISPRQMESETPRSTGTSTSPR